MEPIRNKHTCREAPKYVRHGLRFLPGSLLLAVGVAVLILALALPHPLPCGCIKTANGTCQYVTCANFLWPSPILLFLGGVLSVLGGAWLAAVTLLRPRRPMPSGAG